MYPYKPDKVYQVGAWTIKIFEQEGKALLHKGKNINYFPPRLLVRLDDILDFNILNG